MRRAKAPFTPDQVDAIRAWQECHWVHPLTCGVDSRHGNLTVDVDGVQCSQCDYVQSWVPEVCASGELLAAISRLLNHTLRTSTNRSDRLL